jgi:hypothetical protein
VNNRVGDYCAFAVRFVGLGYLVLWPLASPDPFGLARFCRSDAPYLLCHWPHLLDLTPGLHLIGIFCAGALGVQLLLRGLARWRRTRAQRAQAAMALDARVPAALLRRPRRPPFQAPLPRIKSRSQFGLRAASRHPRDSGVSSPAKPLKPAAPEPNFRL